MKNRQEEILYYLINRNDPVTSLKLSEYIGVSVRTIKSEIIYIKEEIVKHGASLCSKRNMGYYLEIEDENLFFIFADEINMKIFFQGTSFKDEHWLLLEMLRKLIASDKPISLLELAETLFISESHANKLMKKAKLFLISYHLTLNSKGKKGFFVMGEEIYFRFAMTEIYNYHYHKVQSQTQDENYQKWVECPESEKQSIRHIFLKILRESSIKLTDLGAQKCALYLIISRNRNLSGFVTKFDVEKQKEIEKCIAYTVSTKILNSLRKNFFIFSTEKSEISALAMYILCQQDLAVEHIDKLDVLKENNFPISKKNSIVEILNQSFFQDISMYEEEIYELIHRMFRKQKLELDGFEGFGTLDTTFSNHPVSALLADRIICELEERVNLKLSYDDRLSFVLLAYKVLFKTTYPIKKLKLLIAGTSGLLFAQIIEEKIALRYSSFIESSKCTEFYEIRGLDQSQYDAIIIDTMPFFYQYDLPYGTVHIIPLFKEMNAIFDSIFMQAFQFKKEVSIEEQLKIYKDYKFSTLTNFFQFLSYKHSNSEKDRKKMEEAFHRKEKAFPTIPKSGLVIMMNESQSSEEDIVELYLLDKEAMWEGKKVSKILYISIFLENDLLKAKIIENCLQMIQISPTLINESLEKDKKIFTNAMKMYLSLEFGGNNP